jgi:hypothetical protein
MPVHTGMAEVAIARATTSWSKGQVGLGSATPYDDDHVERPGLQLGDCARHHGRCVLALDGRWGHGDVKSQTRAFQASEEVVESFGARAGYETHSKRQPRDPEAALAVVEVLIDQGPDQPGPLGRHPTQQRLGIQFPNHEVDRAASFVEADLAPDPYDHAGFKDDAEAIEGHSDRPPGTGPAFGTERRCARGVGLSRVDKVEEAVPLGQDLHGSDLARYPDLLGEGTPHSSFDPVVELGDGEGVRGIAVSRQASGAGFEAHRARIEPKWVTPAHPG